jgi:hypothetical protein
MGGWCAKRDHCAHYHAFGADQQPSERLCPPGRDGAGPANLVEHDMTRQLSPATQDKIVAMLPDGGLPIRTITLQTGSHIANVRTTVGFLAQAQRLFTARAGTGQSSKPEVWCFPSAETRDAFAATQVDVAHERQQERHRRQAAERKELRRISNIGVDRTAVSIAAQRREDAKAKRRDEQNANAAEEKAQRAAVQAKLRAKTKAIATPPVKRGTSSPAPVEKRGPAHIAGPADLSNAKITRLPTPPSRYAPDPCHVPTFGRIGEYLPASTAAARALEECAA